jgi:hypothetical protein
MLSDVILHQACQALCVSILTGKAFKKRCASPLFFALRERGSSRYRTSLEFVLVTLRKDRVVAQLRNE